VAHSGIALRQGRSGGRASSLVGVRCLSCRCPCCCSNGIWPACLLTHPSNASSSGPFEVIDMCAALDIEPIITLAYDLNDPMDWADLVEYCFGDKSTAWGRRRIADGHPDVYNVSVFELVSSSGSSAVTPCYGCVSGVYYKTDMLAYSTKQSTAALSIALRAMCLTYYLIRCVLCFRNLARDYAQGNEQQNPFFVEQVAAMEARAKSLGPHVPKLYYMFPAGNHNFDTPQSRAQAKAAALPIERLMPDVHVGASGAVEAAAALFEQAGPAFPMSAINCETNAGSHDLLRALNEAADLMDWMNSPTAITDRLYARTASFCTGGSSQFDSWDQVRSIRIHAWCLLELRMSRPGPHIDCHRLGVTRSFRASASSSPT
jgi:hypothetical protein